MESWDQEVQDKRTGTFYTPYWLASSIVDSALSAWLASRLGRGLPPEGGSVVDWVGTHDRQDALQELRSVRVLDPAVGHGVFLVAAAQWLLETRAALGEPRPGSQVRREIVDRALYGVDVRAEAVEMCRRVLMEWASLRSADSVPRLDGHIRHGNSLVGCIRPPDDWDGTVDGLNRHIVHRLGKRSGLEIGDVVQTRPFHWCVEFDTVVQEGGFDVIVGNPPYGNILTTTERRLVATTRQYDVSSGRGGTWSASALFIARALELVRYGGQVALLVPNSIIRVGQFQRTRQLLLDSAELWKIVDEGSPFEDVTLEMVSIFCAAGRGRDGHSGQYVRVASRRPDLPMTNTVPLSAMRGSRLFPIYYDSVFQQVLERGRRGLLSATRGRDVPAKHVSRERTDTHSTPYATSGRSVKRYRFDRRYLRYVDDWPLQDPALRYWYEQEALVATKNYPYPRCVMKPKGMLYGGGTVRVIIRDSLKAEAVGLVLNSRMVRFMCTRYLTNYSRLTTCLNTGIMEEIPLVMPAETDHMVTLFRVLQEAHERTPADGQPHGGVIDLLERTVNGMVYGMYLVPDECADEYVRDAMKGLHPGTPAEVVAAALDTREVMGAVQRVMSAPVVRSVEASPRM